MLRVTARFVDAAERDHFVNITVHGWQWATLIAIVFVLLITDLVVLHRLPREMSFAQAARESAVWIMLGLAFTAVVALWFGAAAAGEYVSGYLIEESLSVDNVFVWGVILTYFAVPREYQFRTLFWGILGALILRAAFIFAGVAIIQRFDFILYFFGAFLIYTAIKLAKDDDDEVDPDESVALRVVRRAVPSTTEYDGQRLFTKASGKRLATPLFAVLVMIATTDIVFAFDSIPAILAVSRETFIVLSSNAFAILGLRALYFCFAGLADRLRYLNIGIAVILGFVGAKMLLGGLFHVPTVASLGVIVVVLGITAITSVAADRREHPSDG